MWIEGEKKSDEGVGSAKPVVTETKPRRSSERISRTRGSAVADKWRVAQFVRGLAESWERVNYIQSRGIK